MSEEYGNNGYNGYPTTGSDMNNTANNEHQGSGAYGQQTAYTQNSGGDYQSGHYAGSFQNSSSQEQETNSTTGYQNSAYTSYHISGDSPKKKPEKKRKGGGRKAAKAVACLLVIVLVGGKMCIRDSSKIVDHVFPMIKTSLTYAEIIAMAGDATAYSIGETAGFPSDHSTGPVGKMSVVFANGLTENDKTLHEFLFDGENYTPSKDCLLYTSSGV